MNRRDLKVAIVAGEASGDNLGVDFIKAFKTHYPETQFRGIGGPKMSAEGCESLYPMETLSVIGIWAILKRLPEFLRLRKRLAQQLIDWQADIFVAIDAPEFNLGLAELLKQEKIKTVHYVSPSVWAWRQGRIHKIKRAVDLMLTLFPFETEIYQQHQVPVQCVGHPLAEQWPIQPDRSEARKALKVEDKQEVLAVLPGSRMSEIEHLGHLFLEVVAELQVHQPDLHVLIPLTNDKTLIAMQNMVDGMELPPRVEFTQAASKEVMLAADVVLLASGTAALEALLLNKPMLVAYRVAPLSYWIYKRMLKVDYYALPNLLAGYEIVREFIQSQADVASLTKEVQRLFKFGLLESQANEYQRIHQSLRRGGGEAAVSAIEKHILPLLND